MILAHCGITATEQDLLIADIPIEGGLDPDQVAEVARRLGLKSEARQLDLESIIELVEKERFPIVLLDRTFLDDEFAIHAVIPIRFTVHYVRILDPLRGERRLSKVRFVKATRRVGGWAVVWEKL